MRGERRWKTSGEQLLQLGADICPFAQIRRHEKGGLLLSKPEVEPLVCIPFAYAFLRQSKRIEFIFEEVSCNTHPFTLPAVSPCTKNRWQKMKITITGISVSTDMANTYPHCVN